MRRFRSAVTLLCSVAALRSWVAGRHGGAGMGRYIVGASREALAHRPLTPLAPLQHSLSTS